MIHLRYSTAPLKSPSGEQLRALCQTLWGWIPCLICSQGECCTKDECPWRRFQHFQPFFNYYKKVTATYVPELWRNRSEQAFRTHEDVMDLLRLLLQHPTSSRDTLTRQFFASRGTRQKPPIVDQHRALNIAVAIIFMVPCAVDSHPGGLLEIGTEPSVWRGDQTLASFLAATFPTSDSPVLGSEGLLNPIHTTKLKATSLRSVANLRFKRTDDLRNHLKLDEEDGIIEIYHHTSVVKVWAEVMALRSDELGGNAVFRLLRPLVLETLGSYDVLFPFDPSSQALLRSLVTKESFDPDCLRLRGAPHVSQDGRDLEYAHWGSRLMALYRELESPRPRGPFETWLERRSQARHAMLAAIAGVAIAILLGILGLGVGIFQAWVAYMAWKYPVENKST